VDSFGTYRQLTVGGVAYRYASLPALTAQGHDLGRLPYSLRVLLENLLRTEDGANVTRASIAALLAWEPAAEPSQEISFTPARVLMQDFTGVPAVVDLAAMRDAMRALGGDPAKINPLAPAELVIDHSVQVDAFGSASAFATNAELEFARNRERYAFLRWGQSAFANFQVVPPDTGIVHQINVEHLARVVMARDGWLYPDTVVGTDSHTTMVNGLGVLGWGVGGIEAEAALLGQPSTMLIPQVVGVRLSGSLPEGATATDLVLRVTELLRRHGVVGKFVEFCGPGLAALPLADRATIANMAPEYGATCGLFPVDAETLAYLRLTGRSDTQVELVAAYLQAQGLFHDADTPEPSYSAVLELDLGSIEPALAGPKRPQDRVALGAVKAGFAGALPQLKTAPGSSAQATIDGETVALGDGAVVIASITSCTNTSNPAVLLAAGLLARNAVAKGLRRAPWVKTSLAPGSQVVTDYLAAAGLQPALDALGFQLVGYGCATCIGNSGPLPEPVSAAISAGKLVAVSVLSGNRNFEGRVHPEVRANYLASPPLVVAYALAGRIDLDLTSEPLGTDADGAPVYLADLWPSQAEVAAALGALNAEMFATRYTDVFAGDERWQALSTAASETFAWSADSTYIKHPPYFEGMGRQPAPVADITGARVLAVLGDSVTTDHISPAGNIARTSPAADYLRACGVEPADFNSYGSRRGNHEVMVRGTFANIRLRNALAPGTEGGVTVHLPSGETTSIYDAAMRYAAAGTPLLVLAGKEYGSGSSRDWAAKGPRLLGVRAVLAESYERIHRSNLVGMGIAPLEYRAGETAASLGLTGHETYAIEGLAAILGGERRGARAVTVRATAADGTAKTFAAVLRIDTPGEADYYRHGGILPFVLRGLL